VLVVGVALAFATLGLLAFQGASGTQNHLSPSILILLASLALTFVAMLLARFGREKVAAAEAFRESEARYRLLADYAADMVIAVRGDGVVSYASPSTQDLLGYEPFQVVGGEATAGVHPEDLESLRAATHALVSGHVREVAHRQRYQRKDGLWVWTEARIRALPNETEPTAYIAAVRDISDQVLMEERLREMSNRDGLTGVGNRRAFDTRLTEEWRRALRSSEPLSVLMVDIDHFKRFNDKLGHLKGDRCLQQVGRLLMQDRRASDFVARFGGEEFVLLLPATNRQGAQTVAEAVRASIEQAAIVHPGSRLDVVTVSVGVATLTFDGFRYASAEGLMADADRMLYAAKRAGRNCVRATDANRAMRVAALA
jgi:diguanylate cyclase (GGDEF)-like protein/PAS domain S-box-containing protein